MKRHVLVALFAVAALAAGLAIPMVALGGGDHKITICHASGREGTTKYETLTIDKHAVYGPAGHFYENGTPRAGHEQDYLGPCQTDTGTTPTDTTPTDTTPTDTTPTETTPTETTPTTPEHPQCPPGLFPYKGKDGKPGNDECCPDSNGNKVCDYEEAVPTTPSEPKTESTPTTTSTEPPPTPATEPPVVPQPDKPHVQTKRKTAVKHATKKKPHLTGNPKEDRCSDNGDGTLNCKGVTVVPGNG